MRRRLFNPSAVPGCLWDRAFDRCKRKVRLRVLRRWLSRNCSKSYARHVLSVLRRGHKRGFFWEWREVNGWILPVR
jgi:hypothetical protein